jgi:hypothetical protein
VTLAGLILPLASVEMYLVARGLRAAGAYPDAKVVRGTGSAADVKAIGAGRGIVLSRGAGPGLLYEWTFDQPIITVRTIGRQNDYDDGEQLAGAVDRWMLADSNVDIGGWRALFVVRTGGGPTCIQVDTARRAHFSCSYVMPVTSGL